MTDHWRYLQALDDDLHQLSRFVEPSQANFATYSIELARMLMIATQECDVLLKAICRNLGHDKANKEPHYRKIIPELLPSFSTTRIYIQPFNYTLVPFVSWQTDDTPRWWTANNKVKHHRQDHFERANVENVLHAIAGLLTVNLYFHRDERKRATIYPALHYFRPALHICGETPNPILTYGVPD